MEKSANAKSLQECISWHRSAQRLVLFLPITTFLIKPAINSITTVLAMESQKTMVSEDINLSIRNITLVAIGFHLI